MPTAIEFIADRLPRVTVEDVRRFADTVEIRDAPAFAAELQAFIHERVEAVKLPANLEGETVEHALKRKTAALRAETRWAPTETDVQRGRAVLLETFNQPHNLPDRQLDPVKQQLTQTVLQEVEGIDPWTIYRALSEPLEGLGGRSPVDAVTHGTIDDVAEAVFNVLGVQVH